MEGFRFKQFYVEHAGCAMKVGTDGTLLGAWTPLPDEQNGPAVAIDAGTGSGLIALMLAQRLHRATITGLDIDEAAAAQARKNFDASPWKEQMRAVAMPFRSFAQTVQKRSVSLVVSNPPYFENSLKNPDESRKTARHTDTLSFRDVLECSAPIMKTGGILSLILPAEQEEAVIARGRQYGFYPTRLTRVCTREGAAPKRILIAFLKEMPETELRTDTLCLMGKDGAPRSKEYSELCKDFYL